MGMTDAQSGHERSAPSARAPGSAAPAGPAAARPAPNPRAWANVPADNRMPIDFAAEYQKAYRVLWVVAAGVLGRSAGAEDVLQDAALLALKKVDQFEPGTHFVAWMAQMVRFVALNQLRKQTRSHATSLDGADAGAMRELPHRTSPPEAPGGGGGADLRLGPRGQVPPGQRSFDDELMRALGALSEVARACLLLRTIEGLDYQEIGRVLDIPEGTAMSHVHRSRMRLRELLHSKRHAASSTPRLTATEEPQP